MGRSTPHPPIMTRMIATHRLTIHALVSGPEAGVPVVLLHGNLSAATLWEETIHALPATYRVIAPDLRGFGATEARPIDASRGLRDWSDDLHALTMTLGLDRFHLVAWSLGAGVALQYAIEHAADLRSLTLVAPLSPFGLGGTRDTVGTPTWPDYAGSGAGLAHPELVQRLRAGDRGAESQFSPRTVLTQLLCKPPFRPSPEREETLVSAMLATRIGDDFFPGDLTSSPHWPGVAPGRRGIFNALAPCFCQLGAFAAISPQPPVLWVRGADDPCVSDTSLLDVGYLGQLGLVPGWPGAEIYPPQPMLGQMRAVLERYRANGGTVSETVLPDCGHTPPLEQPEELAALVLGHWRQVGG